MIRLVAAVGVLLSTSAVADVGGNFRGRMALVDGDGAPCIARVLIENRAGMYHEIERLEVPEGVIAIEYETIGGHNPTDHDIITVQSVPDGLVADPMRIELPDGDTGEICLMLGVGV